MAARDFEICIDATDPERLRPFWRAALDYVDQPTKEGGIDLADPAGVRPAIWLQRGAGAPRTQHASPNPAPNPDKSRKIRSFEFNESHSLPDRVGRE